MKKNLLVAVASAVAFIASVFAEDLLFVESEEYGSIYGYELDEAISLNFTTKVVTEEEWRSMNTTDFAAFRAIIIGDPDCSGSDSTIQFLEDTLEIWSPAVTGNIVVHGTDQSYHYKTVLIDDSIKFAAAGVSASGSSQTGLYFSLSCYYNDFNVTTVNALSYFGEFEVRGQLNCYNEAHIVATSPAIDTLTDEYLSDWGCSVHEAFSSYPSVGTNGFQALAIADGVVGLGTQDYGDGHFGLPYIISRGATPAGCGDGHWDPSLGEECDDGNTEDGDGCSKSCKCESGHPRVPADGTCLAVVNTTSTTNTSTTYSTNTTSTSDSTTTPLTSSSSVANTTSTTPVSSSSGIPAVASFPAITSTTTSFSNTSSTAPPVSTSSSPSPSTTTTSSVTPTPTIAAPSNPTSSAFASSNTSRSVSPSVNSDTSTSAGVSPAVTSASRSTNKVSTAASTSSSRVASTSTSLSDSANVSSPTASSASITSSVASTSASPSLNPTVSTTESNSASATGSSASPSFTSRATAISSSAPPESSVTGSGTSVIAVKPNASPSDDVVSKLKSSFPHQVTALTSSASGSLLAESQPATQQVQATATATAAGAGGTSGASSAGDQTNHGRPGEVKLPGPLTQIDVYFNGVYLCLVITVLFKSLWGFVFASTKMIEPFHQLAGKRDGASAKESLLSDYLSSGLSLESLRNIFRRHWVMTLTAAVYIVANISMAIASESMRIKAGNECTPDKPALCNLEWVVEVKVVRAVEAFLALTSALILLRIILGWRRPSGVYSYPGTIASMAALLSNPAVIEDFRKINPQADSDELAKALVGNRYALGHYETSPGVVRYGLMKVGHPETVQSSHSDPSQRKSEAKSSRSLSWDGLLNSLFLLVHLALFGLFLGYQLQRDTNILLNKGRFGARFLLTVLVTLIGEQWKRLECEVRIMTPYRRLEKQKTGSRDLIAMSLHGIPLKTFPYAIWYGNFFHAFVAFVAILSDCLIIAIAGIPYNFGVIKNESTVSSSACLVILGAMIVTIILIFIWRWSNPDMPRKPNTLANVWMMLCASKMLDDFDGLEQSSSKSRELALRTDGRRYWFGRRIGVDGIERVMVDEDNSERENS